MDSSDSNGKQQDVSENVAVTLMCGTCVCKLEQGEVRLRRNLVLSETHLQNGLILACVAVPLSESITINYDDF